MKYIKTYELFHPDSGLREQIIAEVEDLTYSETYVPDIEECPFATELAILHQKEYIGEIYDSMKEHGGYNISKFSREDFFKEYYKLIKEAKKKIMDDLTKDPSLYDRWFKPDYDILDIPDWIKSASKYNL